MKLRTKIIISALVILIIFLGIISGLIFSRSGYKLTARPSVRVFDLVMDAKYKGKDLELTEDDINSILSMIFKDGITEGDITVYGAEVKLKSSVIYIYSPISFKGVKALLSASGSIAEDGDRVYFKPSYINVGRIKLPAHFILSKLEGSKISFFQIRGDSIVIDKSSLPLSINSIQAADNHMILIFNKEDPASDEKPIENTAGKTADANKNTGAKSKAAVSKPKAAPVGQKALMKLSSQLSSAISRVNGDKEKSILSRVKSSVDKKIADPAYNISKGVTSVKSSYISLTLDQRNHIKGAILSSVNMGNAMELREIFGI